MMKLENRSVGVYDLVSLCIVGGVHVYCMCGLECRDSVHRARRLLCVMCECMHYVSVFLCLPTS